MLLRVTPRTAEKSDAAFAYNVREKAMRVYEEATWGGWDTARSQELIEEDISKRRLSLIELDREAAGIVRVNEHPTHIQLDQLFLLPNHQNRGIGTYFVEDLLRAAKLEGRPIKLWVLQVNPARRFYDRLGFRVIEETAASLHLQSAA